MKAHELTGTALDWAVAKYQGFTDYDPATETMLAPRKEYGRVNVYEYSYSTDWSLAGEIIEREGISLSRCGKHSWSEWGAVLNDFEFEGHGATPLIAAMRCYVASKQGEQDANETV